MLRLVQRQREAIAHAFKTIGQGCASRLVHVDFLCADPIFVGLHDSETTADGRSYRGTAHCALPVHTTDHSTTIVLPVPEEPWVIVHELGHALQWKYARDHVAAPVTEYAKTNQMEAFADAFVARFYHYGDQDAMWRDGATRDLFDGLTA
jgi:hypothetical protein